MYWSSISIVPNYRFPRGHPVVPEVVTVVNYPFWVYSCPIYDKTWRMSRRMICFGVKIEMSPMQGSPGALGGAMVAKSVQDSFSTYNRVFYDKLGRKQYCATYFEWINCLIPIRIHYRHRFRGNGHILVVSGSILILGAPIASEFDLLSSCVVKFWFFSRDLC